MKLPLTPGHGKLMYGPGRVAPMRGRLDDWATEMMWRVHAWLDDTAKDGLRNRIHVVVMPIHDRVGERLG